MSRNAHDYHYKVRWSYEDRSFVATAREFPSLSWLDTNRVKAEQGILTLVNQTINDLLTTGEQVPEPESNPTHE